MISANGQGFKRVTGDLADKRAPAWSPDGLRIAYESWHDGFLHIYVMDSSGKNPIRLTHNQAHNMVPTWSPDGQTIAYVSSNGFNAGARQEIHLMIAEGEHLRQLSEVHDGADFDPDFGAAELAVFPASNNMTTWGEIKASITNRR